jgi:protein-S-isoprenylcysteine O-methyltransferase Ste14
MSVIFIPAWVAPPYVLVWTALRVKEKERRKALRGFLAAGGAWLGSTILFVVLGLMISPCIHACGDRFRTPIRDALTFVLVLAYGAAAAYIVYRLHRYGRRPA